MSSNRFAVASIDIDGAKKTNDQFLREHFAPLLQARSLSELSWMLEDRFAVLSQLDILKDYSIDLQKKSKGTIHLRIGLQEKSYKVNIGTELGAGSGSISSSSSTLLSNSESKTSSSSGLSLSGMPLGAGAGITLYNVFGGAEKVSCNYLLGTQTVTPFSLLLSKPIAFDPNRLIQLSFSKTLSNSSNSSNPLASSIGLFPFQHDTLKANALYRRILSSPNPQHNRQLELYYDASLRQLSRPLMSGSRQLLEAMGSYLTSMVGLAYSSSTLDDQLMPKKGWMAKWRAECFGLADGQPAELKGEASFKAAITLGVSQSKDKHLRIDGPDSAALRNEASKKEQNGSGWLTLSASLRAGCMVGLPSLLTSSDDHHNSSTHRRRTCPMDLFFAGGPSSVRGYAQGMATGSAAKDAWGMGLPVGFRNVVEASLSAMFPIIPRPSQWKSKASTRAEEPKASTTTTMSKEFNASSEASAESLISSSEESKTTSFAKLLDKMSENVRGHVFLSAAHTSNVLRMPSLSPVDGTVSVSCGFGLAVRVMNSVRVEVNIAGPMERWMASSVGGKSILDNPRGALCIGFGAEFM